MRRSATVLLVAVALIGLVGCADEADITGDQASPTTVADADANFFLTVSNQSFERPTVFVEVAVDDERVVAQSFDVEGQHTARVRVAPPRLLVRGQDWFRRAR